MKIKAKELREFMEKSLVGKAGSCRMLTTHWRTDEGGVYSKVMDNANIVLSETILDKKAFIQYGKEEEMFLPDGVKMLQLLATFDDDIELKVEGTILKVFDQNRCIEYPLAEKEACDNVFEKNLPDLPTSVVVSVEKTFLTKAVADMGLLKEGKIAFIAEDGYLKLKVGGDTIKTENKVKIDSKEKAFVKLGEAFLNVVSICEDKVKLHLGENVPIIVENNTDRIKNKILIAPIIENEEEQREEETITEEPVEETGE